MADYSGVMMQIGGTIKLSDLDKLIDAAEEDGAGLNYDSVTAEEIFEEIMDCANKGAPIAFSGSEVAWGRFESLEEVCKELGLTYLNQSDACVGAWGQMLEFWEQPADESASGDPISYSCEEDGMPVLSVQSIRKLLAEDKLMGELERMERIHEFKFPLVILDDCFEERGRLLAELAELDARRCRDPFMTISEGPADVIADRRREIANRLDEIGTEAP